MAKELSELTAKERIAKRAVQEFNDGDLVNLGVGLPVKCAEFVEEGKTVFWEAENGVIASVALLEDDVAEEHLFDAGGVSGKLLPEGSIIDSATSFGIIRGGHLDATVLGFMQVDESGNIANWMAPGGHFSGVGGAMDLVNGAKKVVCVAEHCTKDGKSKIMKKCTYPLTGVKVVDLIITELAVFKVTDEGLLLTEIAAGVSLEELREKTEADFIISENLKEIEI